MVYIHEHIGLQRAILRGVIALAEQGHQLVVALGGSLAKLLGGNLIGLQPYIVTLAEDRSRLVYSFYPRLHFGCARALPRSLARRGGGGGRRKHTVYLMSQKEPGLAGNPCQRIAHKGGTVGHHGMALGVGAVDPDEPATDFALGREKPLYAVSRAVAGALAVGKEYGKIVAVAAADGNGLSVAISEAALMGVVAGRVDLVGIVGLGEHGLAYVVNTGLVAVRDGKLVGIGPALQLHGLRVADDIGLGVYLYLTHKCGIGTFYLLLRMGSGCGESQHETHSAKDNSLHNVRGISYIFSMNKSAGDTPAARSASTSMALTSPLATRAVSNCRSRAWASAASCRAKSSIIGA